uniref:Reverse transcriptase zinc-binding domain-containing protein n=1 Tax=Oryza nivara TaxID=4536 RepID=A0A0E0HKH4_ORYNI
MPTAPPRLQIDAADAHHTHHQECPYALAVSTVSGIPIVLLHTSPQLLAPPNPISNHLNARGWKPSWRNGKGRMMTGKLSFHVPGGIMRGFFLMVLSSRRHFSYAGFEQQPKKFVSPKILLLNIEQELKYEKENAEISLHLLKCPIVVKGDNTLAWMMPRFVGFEGKNVEYSTRSAYQIQFLGEIRFIWEGKAEGKCKFFMWLTAQRKILTTDKLQLRG